MRKVRFGDIETLVQEIKSERAKSRALKKSIDEWEQTCRQLEIEEKTKSEEEDPTLKIQSTEGTGESEWKTRFETQTEINRQLESQLQGLRKRLAEKKAEVKELTSGGGLVTYRHSDLKKLIIRLQREKNNLESQMKDYEWRIDKESELYHKAMEKRKAVYFDIKRQQQNPAQQSAPVKLKAIKPGKLAKGSYVRKLLQRRSSMMGQKPALSIGSPPPDEETGGASTRHARQSPVRSAGQRPSAVQTLPKIGQAIPPKRTTVKLRAEGSEIRKTGA